MLLKLCLSCRYVVRAGAGKKQSSKDASGKAANSAGASLRRYNELALKKVLKMLIFCQPNQNHANFVFIASVHGGINLVLLF